MNYSMEEDKAVYEWLQSSKKHTAYLYKNRWLIWVQYCRTHGIPESGTEQLEDMKKRRLSGDNTEKYFYDNEVPKFFRWVKTEFKGKNTKKPLSEGSALAVVTAVRSFFAYHRYSLEIKKEALPSSEKTVQVFEDHAFDIYQLRSMFQQGDLKERTILACGKDLWLRAGDFTSLNRNFIELAIKREQELAENEKREPDVIEFELSTEKESEPCSCHLSKETIELLKEYLRTYAPTNEHLFPMTEEALSDLLRRLAEKSKITLSGRVRWHCLRKFGITLMHGRVTEPVMKYMTGKHISKDLRTYIQNNQETFKAFRLLEPLLSLTKTNGNGSGRLAKELEELKKEIFRRKILEEFIEKSISKETKQQVLNEMAQEYGLEPIDPDKKFTQVITEISEKAEKKDLKRILEENGNNNNHS